ncbi:MAG: lysozyme [Vibrio anguillarum]
MNNKLAGATLAAALLITGALEGTRYVAYQDSVGKWTICNGATKGVKKGDTATPEYCRDRLVVEILKHAEPLQRVPHQLPDHVIIAWADFAFNTGVGTLVGSSGYKNLMRGNIAASCPNLLAYKYITMPNNKKINCYEDKNRKLCGGIKYRRHLEYNLCAGKISIDDAIREIKRTHG